MKNQLMEQFNPTDLSDEFIAVFPSTPEDYQRVFTAVNNPTYKLNEHINETIDLTNFYLQPIEAADSQTGEVRTLVRSVLIDANGDSFACASSGVYNALRRMTWLFGMPATWQAPITVKVKAVNVSKGQMLTLDVVSMNNAIPNTDTNSTNT